MPQTQRQPDDCAQVWAGSFQGCANEVFGDPARAVDVGVESVDLVDRLEDDAAGRHGLLTEQHRLVVNAEQEETVFGEQRAQPGEPGLERLGR